LLKRRIERAAPLLKQGDLAIVQVAHEFGFADQAHFTRVFKQVKGVTPKRFLAQGL
jgi:AraC family transcriptional regulator